MCVVGCSGLRGGGAQEKEASARCSAWAVGSSERLDMKMAYGMKVASTLNISMSVHRVIFQNELRISKMAYTEKCTLLSEDLARLIELEIHSNQRKSSENSPKS
ncbi:hypothetical protein O3M35_004450 [Rhynocoris fuscipes]|uniref:Uncharacterized protein n=1 Tax=Rhynocoris fuscipes TaxID=488301 RepID=A0AAW1CFY7_9HEMI